ncbi:MAG: hypothetical protein DWQ19_09550 [Crenarchaeota archaeon]|nr:MAG: hypothetical protein DWQ19_09550 [Thermoproteota archaeon]
MTDEFDQEFISDTFGTPSPKQKQLLCKAGIGHEFMVTPGQYAKFQSDLKKVQSAIDATQTQREKAVSKVIEIIANNENSALPLTNPVVLIKQVFLDYGLDVLKAFNRLS